MANIGNLKRSLSRKQFLQLSAVGTAAGLLTGCQAAPAAAPTETVIPATPTAEPTAAAAGLPEIIRKYPDALSRVVKTKGAGVWEGDALSPAVLRRMLDASITKLTGKSDAREAWAALFSADDKVAIKVNAFRNSLIWTHVPLVTAVTDSLQEAGMPAEQIVIFDAYTTELTTAGFTENRDGAGVRCYGSDYDYPDNFEVAGTKIQLSPIITGCTALINMPVLKSHIITGITFAMKNHFGSTQTPELLHNPAWDKMAGLNALAPIKERTRLIIGDMLEANLHYSGSYPYWKPDYRGDSILMSFDPVAHDTVGLDVLTELLAAEGSSVSLLDSAQRCLDSGATSGIGTNLPENIEVVEASV
ncbi:MAG: DUF362 domain-containing protein [Anaerolineales bacterium]|nr:DUF362 domain-containing protein [Anaerolineales bacterium]